MVITRMTEYTGPEFSTPMMQQYLAIKQAYADCVVFYRLGDFYEMFLEDAELGARVLDITLTSRTRGKDGRIPMAGVPYHAVDSYLPRLVAAGYKVAICEQVTPPDGKNLVERKVVRIVTPGTMLTEQSLEHKEHSLVMAIQWREGVVGVAAADLSTGELYAGEAAATSFASGIMPYLLQLPPRECLLPPELYNQPDILGELEAPQRSLFCDQKWSTHAHAPTEYLEKHFGVKTLAGLGLSNSPLAQETLAVVLRYLTYTQQQTPTHLQRVHVIHPQTYLHLDQATITNLEIFSTLYDHQYQGSLLSVIDQTQTAAGGRLLRTWLRQPLTDLKALNHRQTQVAELLSNTSLQHQLRLALATMNDIERKLARLSVGIGTPRDLLAIQQSLGTALKIHQLLTENPSSLGTLLPTADVKKIRHLEQLLQTQLVDEPPIDPKQGKIIKPGVHAELDQLRSLVQTGQDWLVELERQEKQTSGLSNLKVGFNNVFGFYIEVSKAQADRVPAHYLRKQTLVNAERFITPELKEHEHKILTAQSTSQDLEYQLFLQLVAQVTAETTLLQTTAHRLAELDVVSCFAAVALAHDYCRPELNTKYELVITASRHLVIEHYSSQPFVPNDVTFDRQHQILLITGPNMAGKSVLMRQVALIALLAHVGSYVPATTAQIGLIDRICVRSGASDMITAGLSTFMVEMVETAAILNQATDRSLIIMDEIGRGTSTFDGISIASAVASYLATTPGKQAKTLFATHYHELQQLADTLPNIHNYHLAVTNEGGQLQFLYQLQTGGSSHSWGLAVAQLAGLPASVVTAAQARLTQLEQQPPSKKRRAASSTPTSSAATPHPTLAKLQQLDLNNLTPRAALDLLYQLQQEAHDHA